MLSHLELNKLKNSFKTKKFVKGDVIFPQGAVADGAYIVISGSVLLKKHHYKSKMIEHIGTIKKGDTFGAWYVLFESDLRPLSAESNEDSELIFIPNDILVDKLKKSDPFILYCFRKWIDLTSKNVVPKKNVLKNNNSD
jgi:CRP-like cAMP-binding protein